MDIYTPYFYIIQEISSGRYYAGSKYSRSANPDLLLKEYFTSSTLIKDIVSSKGAEAFVIRKIRTFKTKNQAYEYETKFLMKVDAKKNPKFFNKHNNDFKSTYDPEWRKIKDEYGLTSYLKGAAKATETMLSTITDGKNVYQISYQKALEKNPDLNKIRTAKAMNTMLKVDEKTGLDGYQKNGLKIRGINNPSKKPENAKKISEARKNGISNNKEEWLKRQKKLNEYLSSHKDKNGMTARDRHSEWMKENNPTRGSKWFNNGKENVRLKEGENIPEGYSPGRIRKS